MTSLRLMSPLLLALLCAPAPALAAPADGLVVTQLPDPDPGYVAPKPDKSLSTRRAKDSDENPTLDQAFENLGKVTGELAQRMGAQYRASPDDLKAAQERLRQRLEEQAGLSSNK